MAPTSKRKYVEKVTRLTSIDWEVGRLGILTPVAVCKPVVFDKGPVQRFLVYNYHKIKRMGLELNDWVDVIQFSKNTYAISAKAERLPNDNPIRITPPASCPSCGTKLSSQGAIIKCPNVRGCRDQIIQRISHYLNTGALGVKGLNLNNIGSLYDKGILTSPADIYRLKNHRRAVGNTPKLSADRANSLIEKIDGSLKIPLSNFIYGLGIPGVGMSTIDKLSEIYGDLQTISTLTVDELKQLKGINLGTASAIANWFADTDNQQLIADIKAAGARIQDNRSVRPQ